MGLIVLLVHFLIFNGIGQNITAGAIVGIPSLVLHNRSVRRHVTAEVERLHRHHPADEGA